jgi:hypothetical protein
MPTIEMPNGDLVEFDDSYSKDQIKGMIASKFPDLANQQTPQPQQPTMMDKAKAGAYGFASSIPAGNAITSAIPAAIGALSPNQTFKDLYTQSRLDEKSAKEKAPAYNLAGTGLGIAAQLPVGLGAGFLSKGNLAMKAAKGAAVGGLGGAVYGAGEAAPDMQSVVEGAKGGALGGAAFGAAAPAVGAALQKVPDIAKGAIKAATTKEIFPNSKYIKRKATFLFNKAEKSNATFSQNLKQGYFDSLVSQLPQSIEVDAPPVLKELAEKALKTGDRNWTLKDFDEVDKKLGTEAWKAFKAGDDDLSRRLASVKSDLNNSINVADETNGLLVGGADGIAALKEGKRLWSVQKKLETIENILEAVPHSMPRTARKTAFRRIANNEKLLAGFDKEEIELIKKAAENGGIEDLVSTMGSRLGAVVGLASGNPANAALLYGGSALARGAADKIALKKGEEIAKQIARRSGLVREVPRFTTKEGLKKALRERK